MKYKIQKILFSPKTQTFHAELEPLEKPIKGFCIDYPEGKVIDIARGLENRCKKQTRYPCDSLGVYSECLFGVKGINGPPEHCKHYLRSSNSCANRQAQEDASK